VKSKYKLDFNLPNNKNPMLTAFFRHDEVSWVLPLANSNCLKQKPKNNPGRNRVSTVCTNFINTHYKIIFQQGSSVHGLWKRVNDFVTL
jgi:hypothetical protein